MTSIIKTTYVDNRNTGQYSCGVSGKKAAVCAAVFPLLLTGCEAPLNLEGVNNELEKQVRRTDQFQGVAVNDNSMVVVGADGLVLTSPVDKLEWKRQEIKGSPALVDISVCSDQSFVALSMDKQVWFSSDNGQSWTASKLPTPEDVLDLTCAPDNSVWVVGSFSTILNSYDQGKTWAETTLNEDAMLTNIQFLDQSTAILTGEFGLYVRSDDAGQTWNTPEYIPNDFYTQNAHFTSAENGWVAGLSGQILHTADGGVTWTKQNTPTESPLYGFYQAGDRLFAFGDHATVLEYTGMDWKRIPNPNIPVYIRDALQLENGQLLMAGGFGSLYTLDIASGENSQISQK
ncbi:YCF48-related protein [Neptuniibacter sp.]|uniref:WD40/YVTN/BNR-like repeat-containing protein n=1 Tax=Neptuniibacter sp. TaxID=1962643 RepID=UPI00260AE935|nr:YCF48-related protein [Neptuniibacter sp.]MCP4596331.1 glycosyl hydrolase [Neptuniibacter sp.]